MFSGKYNKRLKSKQQHDDDVKGFKISTSQKMYSPFQMRDRRI